MDFSVIFQLRTRKFWWMDVIFYFVISLLVATVICYAIFLVKNDIQRADIKKETAQLKTVGTAQQKQYEQSVLGYQKKINDFTGLLQNHEFASNVFGFMQTQTLPNVWFKQFGFDEKAGSVQLTGEADSMDALSRQVASLEKNKYVQKLGGISSSLGDSAKVEFSVNITLGKNIFGYLSDMKSVLEPAPAASPATSSAQQSNQQSQPGAVQANSAGQKNPAISTNNTPAAPSTGSQQPSQPKRSGKLINSFHFSMVPEVVGTINQAKYTITLSVPYGTDIKNLTPEIVVSPYATVMPASNASQDFSVPLTYTVIAQDGSIQKYIVTVNVLPEAVKKSNNVYGLIALIAGALVILIILATMAFIFFKRKLNRPDKQQI